MLDLNAWKKYHTQRLHEYLRIFEEKDYRLPETAEPIEEVVRLPYNFIPLATSMPSDPDHVAVLRYLFSRGLSKSDFYRFRLGTCTSGRFARRVILPSFDDEGDLNYFTARSINSNGAKKYINSKVKRKEIIFNEINVRWDKPITLVEGPFDLMKCNWNATAMLGSYLDESYLLFRKIVHNNTDVVLAMDSDAEEKKVKLAKKLTSYGINVKSIELDGYGDVGDMTKEKFMLCLNAAESWTSSSALMSKIRNIRSSSFF